MNNLHDNLKVITDYYSNGIKGSSLNCQIAQGKFHLKNKIGFSVLKYGTQTLSILATMYIIYKAIV
jgi:hypothetical protein